MLLPDGAADTKVTYREWAGSVGAKLPVDPLST